MPHLAPILWILVVSMLLVILILLISSFWWMQMSSFSINFFSASLKENSWNW